LRFSLRQQLLNAVVFHLDLPQRALDLLLDDFVLAQLYWVHLFSPLGVARLVVDLKGQGA
jgi:hypothetical protein